MAKVTLANITSDYASRARHNANYAAMAAAMENTLSRDGSLPNHMTAALDMNSKRILNISSGINNTDGVNLEQIYDVVEELTNNTEINIDIIYHNVIVENLAALRAYTGDHLADGQIFYIRGHTTAGDGGGGIFICTTTDPGDDNDGILIDSNTLGFYFERQYSGIPSVLFFGADNTGVTDTSTIFTTLGNIGGAYYCPPGEYLFSSNVTLNKPTRLVGARKSSDSGDEGVLFNFTGADSNTKLQLGSGVEELHGYWLEHIRIDAPNATGGSVLYYNYVSQSGAIDVILNQLGNSAKGINLFRVNTLSFEDVRIGWVTGAGFYCEAEVATRSDAIQLRDCNVSGDSLAAGLYTPNAVELNGYVQTLVIHNLNAVNVGRGIYRHNAIGVPAGQRAEFDFVHSLQVDFPKYECIRIEYGDDLHYTNSYLHGSLTTNNVYIAHDASTSVGNISFIGGKCTSADHNGFSIDGDYVFIQGMVISINGKESSNTYDGVAINANSEGIVVMGCLVGNWNGYATENQRYGISIAAGASDPIIFGNNLSGNVTGSLLDSRSVVVVNRSIVSQNIGQTSYEHSNAHNVDALGTTVNISGYEKLFIVSTGTMTSFTINLQDNPAHGQEIWVQTLFAVTSLTLNAGSGDTISSQAGTIAALKAEGGFALKYDAPTNLWYAIYKNIV